MGKIQKNRVQVLKAELLLQKGFVTSKSAYAMIYAKSAKKGVNLFMHEVIEAAIKGDINYFGQMIADVNRILQDKKLTDLKE
jgi:hypothetical protein